jgi:hypothetical protein
MTYAALIAETTGTTDPATVTLVEELMRSERTALDGLSPAEFTAAVGQALTDAAALARAGLLASYCDALGIAVPAPAIVSVGHAEQRCQLCAYLLHGGPVSSHAPCRNNEACAGAANVGQPCSCRSRASSERR